MPCADADLFAMVPIIDALAQAQAEASSAAGEAERAAMAAGRRDDPAKAEAQARFEEADAAFLGALGSVAAIRSSASNARCRGCGYW
jgi:hypothetical protein